MIILGVLHGTISIDHHAKNNDDDNSCNNNGNECIFFEKFHIVKKLLLHNCLPLSFYKTNRIISCNISMCLCSSLRITSKIDRPYWSSISSNKISTPFLTLTSVL